MGTLLDDIACDETSLRREAKYRKRTEGKPADQRFEDRVWLLFRRMGFTCLNKGRELVIDLPVGGKKNIDVFASDGSHYFIIDCKHTSAEKPISLRKHMAELEGYKKQLRSIFKRLPGEAAFGRPHFLFVLSSQDARAKDAEFAHAKRTLLWSGSELRYWERLVERMEQAAKYQLYAITLRKHKNNELRRCYPCIRGEMGGNRFYTLVLPVSDVLDYAYVHHRELSSIRDATQAYQRMLQKGRLKKVSRYVGEEHGFFPNNVILGFDKPLTFNKRKSETRVARSYGTRTLQQGTLTLPAYHGCAWVIDGQHRLYGLALTQAGRDQAIPVVAFEGMTTEEQARLFVDINKKQKRIEGNLLWDLYSDIYRGATQPRELKLYHLARLGKLLATEEGPLSGHIYVPSVPGLNEKSETVNIMLTTVCTTVGQHAGWPQLRDPKHQNHKPAKIASVINAYLEVARDLWPEQWRKGDAEDGFLRTNRGLGVLLMILGDFLRHFVSRQMLTLVHRADKARFQGEVRRLLRPALDHLKSDEGRDDRSRIKTATGRGAEKQNATLLEIVINDVFPEFRPPRIEALLAQEARPSPVSGEAALRQKCRKGEAQLRAFVLERLVETHGDGWWTPGVPSRVRHHLEREHTKWRRSLPAAATAGQSNPENMFERCSYGQLKETVVYKRNWPHFEDEFGEQERFRVRLTSLSTLRAGLLHERDKTITSLEVAEGSAALLWLSEAIGDPRLAPE